MEMSKILVVEMKKKILLDGIKNNGINSENSITKIGNIFTN